jgi:DNA-binding LacI/PurR family transcriptional regulator
VEFAGIAVIVCSTDNRSDREVDYLELIHARRAKAVLCGTAGASPASNDMLRRLLAKGVRVVTMGHRLDPPQVTSVASDSKGGMRKAVQHLVAFGHKRIGYIGFSAPSVGGSREAGFRAAVLDALGDPDPPVTKGAGDPVSAQTAVRGWIDQGRLPSAIMAGNDLMAMGALLSLRDRGVRVPENVSVVGFDDIDLAAFTRPTLTTVRQPIEQMAACVAQLFADARPGEAAPGGPHIFPAELIVRESTGPPPSTP